jgi:hypothetical protein
VAEARRLRLERIPPGRPIAVSGDRALIIRGGRVGVIGADSVFRPFPTNEEIVIDGTLYIPPLGTRNRQRSGILGPYRLLLANGIGLHGTPDKASIGTAATHGCIRLHDEDITWLYTHVPIGTPVIIR